MFGKLLKTDDDVAALVLRLGLGIVMFPHGAQKVFGWFGGYGLAGTWGFMTGQMHIPAVFAALAITAEFAGSLGLIVGLLGRVAAFGLGVEMAVAAFLGGHVANGFFMNWSGHQAGEGFEYHILVVVIALAVMIKGSGALSLDRLLAARSR
ncbi:MAG: DoxX family protein [Thermoanaerobaculaceae bacterium]|nr:DoxX family protein [Thermoanaerobaculaceae bacterium]TAM55782.1 MAG: DoxX family protein [Acidobacteriota bacterium]